MIFALTWWTGCGGEPPAQTDLPAATAPTEGTTPPTTYIFEEGAPPEPTASLADLGLALQQAVDVAMQIQAGPVQTAYDAAMAGSTSACPYVYQTPDGAYWYDSCTSSEGTAFDGYVFAYGDEGLFDPSSGFVFDYWYAFGGATIDTPAGDQLELAGLALWQLGVNDNGGDPIEIRYTELAGTFAWDGDETAGTWMDLGIDPDLVVSVTAIPTLALATVALDGGFGGFGDGWAVGFDDNQLGSAALGMPCEREPSGTVGLRAPDGTWYDVQFDGGVAGETVEAEVCDGCGHTFYRGEPIGEVCADFAPWMAAGVAPW